MVGSLSKLYLTAPSLCISQNELNLFIKLHMAMTSLVYTLGFSVKYFLQLINTDNATCMYFDKKKSHLDILLRTR